MNSQRVACKFFVAPDPTAPVELHPFIGLFHRFIQEAVVEGLLIDVADYAHVPEGPGVILIGHDVDYGIDLTAGRAGLLTTRKRYGDLPLADVARDTLRMALLAVDAIEGDPSSGIRFATGAVTLQLVDRLGAPNEEAAFAAAAQELAPVFADLYGEKHEVARAHAEDPRKTLSISVTTSDAIPAAELAERLGGRAQRKSGGAPSTGARAPQQSEWDISVEDLEALRDSNAGFTLVDVREPHEREICHLEGVLIPLKSLPERLRELDEDAHVVVYCRSGARSAKAVQLLRGAGFGNAWNVNGGILAWIDRIDPSLTPY